MNVFDTLRERGFIAQATHEDRIRDLLGKEKITFYIGFDPTADSLHIGHFLQLMAMAHLQRQGHRPIVVLGSGTAMVGDPSGKSDMRKMLTRVQIQHNADRFRKQMSRFIDFSDGKALILDNYDWLGSLNYIDFLREIGVHFSVNRMLTAECFRTRLEKGLTFIEFNYMLMQSYDFLILFRNHGCVCQLGGDDQWSNIISGTDLIRRVEQKETYGLTFQLLQTSDGAKMGKTEKGAIWLDEDKTSPYDFYQYWRNIRDGDVEKCLKLLTFLPMDEIRELSERKDSQVNQAKEVLAFEVTRIVHGDTKGEEARETARALFVSGESPEHMPTIVLQCKDLEKGMDVLELLVVCRFAASKGEARRLVLDGGISINEEKVEDFRLSIGKNLFRNGQLMIRKGKKKYFKVYLE